MNWTITLTTEDGVGKAHGQSGLLDNIYRDLTEDELVMLQDPDRIGVLRSQLALEFDGLVTPTKVLPVIQDYGKVEISSEEAATTIEMALKIAPPIKVPPIKLT